jgi:hypothetical protein
MANRSFNVNSGIDADSSIKGKPEDKNSPWPNGMDIGQWLQIEGRKKLEESMAKLKLDPGKI